MMNLGVPGDGGACCPCADQNGCECNVCTELECRSRGGEVALCGHEEYPGYESTPPRFYLKKQFGGESIICTCPSAGCDNVDLAGPLSCAIDKTNGSGCSYYGLAEILNIFDSGGGVIKYTGRATFTGGIAGSSPCDEVLATAATVGGAFFYFSDSNGGATATVDASGGSTCSGGAATAFASVVLTMDIPGFAGTQSCSVTRSTRLDSPIVTKIISYEGEISFDPLISCDTPNVSTGKRRDSECTSYLCRQSHDACGSTIEAAITSVFEDDTFLNSYLQTTETSSTTKTQDNPIACAPGTTAAQAGSERFEQLQSEDTDEDALARLLAGPGGLWSPWTPVGDGTGGTCLNPPCCKAEWEIRTDRTFAYREAEFRATVGGLFNGQLVDITIRVYRRAFGSADLFELFEDLVYSDVAASGGTDDDTPDADAQIEDTVPNAEGFETYVTCTYSIPEPTP